jgi:uncharacterized protein (UPF0276 family)
MTPRVGLSLMPQSGFREAVAPLFAAGEVAAVEWTIDIGFGRSLPAFIEAILDVFSASNQLYGHGTGYSPLGRDEPAWRDRAADALGRRPYRHLTEHFGFCTGGDFVFGPPLPVPRDPGFVAIGRDKLARLRDAVGVPVGLENLALGFCADDALSQGDMLEEILAPIDGILHLDLHNLWTQAVNFHLDPVDLAARYPLHRARIVHVSGGTWISDIRRDTHDGEVPDEVLALLAALLPRLPAEAVLLERIGTAFQSPDHIQGFRRDFARLREVVNDA